MITYHDPSYISLSIPVPVPLKYVNVYLVKSPEGWKIVDTGMNTVEARETWQRAFAELNLTPGDIKEIILTHYHPDHLGLAGWLHEITGAAVRISETGKRAAEYIWQPEQPQARETTEFFLTHGMPEEECKDIEDHMIDFMKYITTLPPLTPIRKGEKMMLAGDEVHIALDTPGHCDGHFSFIGEDSRMLIGGDQLLLKISPNVSLWPGMDPNPLQSYIDSLKELRELSISKVYPGHGPVFTEVNERIDELLHHHELRLEEIIGYLKEGGAQSAYQICRKLFSNRKLDLQQLRFAMSEALAHLVFLEKEQLVQREDIEGKTFFYLR